MLLLFLMFVFEPLPLCGAGVQLSFCSLPSAMKSNASKDLSFLAMNVVFLYYAQLSNIMVTSTSVRRITLSRTHD